MTIRTILVQLDAGRDAGDRLGFAAALARRLDAGLIGLAAVELRIPVARDRTPLAAADRLQEQRDVATKMLHDLRDQFHAVCDELTLSWRGLIGHPGVLLAEHARAADLIVTGSDSPGIDPGELVLAAGRPVLLAGQDLAPLGSEPAVVAWKDSREARRALSDAIPLLAGAEEVLVATAAEANADPDSAADAVALLERHGIRARHAMVEDRDREPPQAIADFARHAGARLVVSGAYARSRLRHWVFGGMTSSLIADGSMHRLLSN